MLGGVSTLLIIENYGEIIKRGRKKGLHIPNFVEVFPEFHPRRVCAELAQIRPQEHFPVKNLGAVLIGLFIERTFETRASRCECAGCDVVRQEFVVDDVDDGGDEGLYVFRAGNEGLDIAYDATRSLLEHALRKTSKKEKKKKRQYSLGETNHC